MLLSTVRLIMVVSLSVVIVGCEPGGAVDKPYYHLVETANLMLHPDHTVTHQFVGNVEAAQRVDLAFELPGTVLTVNVDEGDTVSVGQELMRLDTRLLEEERVQLQALRKEIVAKQALVKLEIERHQRLQQKGLAAQQRRDELDAQTAVLAAQFGRQQSRLSAVAVRISKSVIKAPYNAYISARYFDAGAVVSPAKAVLQLLKRGNFEARVGVPAKLAQTVKSYGADSKNTATYFHQHQPINIGKKLVVSFVDQSQVNASVIAVGRSIDPVTRTVAVRLALPAGLRVINGDLVFLHIAEYQQQAGFWVPLEALNGSVRGMWNLMVLVPTDNNDLYRLEARSVELLHRANGRVFVRGSLVQGEQYMVHGLQRVVAGQLVRARAHNMTMMSNGGQ